MQSPRMIETNGQLLVDANDGSGARWPVADNDPMRATFGLFVPAFVPAANPTDFLVVAGSATRTVRIRALLFSGTATAATNILLQINRRATANTGGTFTTQALVNRDSADLSPTSSVALYSANPSALGTSIGVADGGRLNLAPNAIGSVDRLTLQYGWFNDKAPILHGPSDFLCIGLNGAAWPAGGALDINLVLTED